MAQWICDAGAEQCARAEQQDIYEVVPLAPALGAGDLLLALADGMGGEKAGQLASALAMRTFVDTYCTPTEEMAIPARLDHALRRANARIAQEVVTDPDNLGGMGCTFLAVVLCDQGMYWVSVGDSPLWIFRDGQLYRINEEHSYRFVLTYQVSLGQLTEAEAAVHPDRHALISAVTGDPLDLVDLPLEPTGLRSADQVLMASDGILTLEKAELAAILREQRGEEHPTAAILREVVGAQAMRQDNTTVMWAQSMVGWRRHQKARVRVANKLGELATRWLS